MLFENEHFIIKYTESDARYMDEAIERLNNKYDEYMEFFCVGELPKKVEFVLYNDLVMEHKRYII